MNLSTSNFTSDTYTYYPIDSCHLVVVRDEALSDGSVAEGGTVTVADDRILRDFITGDAFALLEAGRRVTQIAETDRRELVRLPSGRVALLDAEPVGS